MYTKLGMDIMDVEDEDEDEDEDGDGEGDGQGKFENEAVVEAVCIVDVLGNQAGDVRLVATQKLDGDAEDDEDRIMECYGQC